jgi:hypothetical protein
MGIGSQCTAPFFRDPPQRISARLPGSSLKDALRANGTELSKSFRGSIVETQLSIQNIPDEWRGKRGRLTRTESVPSTFERVRSRDAPDNIGRRGIDARDSIFGGGTGVPLIPALVERISPTPFSRAILGFAGVRSRFTTVRSSFPAPANPERNVGTGFITRIMPAGAPQTLIPGKRTGRVRLVRLEPTPLEITEENGPGLSVWIGIWQESVPPRGRDDSLCPNSRD